MAQYRINKRIFNKKNLTIDTINVNNKGVEIHNASAKIRRQRQIIENNKILKEYDDPQNQKYTNIYLYRETSLPANGWIQGCDNCCMITTKLLLIHQKTHRDRMYNFYVYRCQHCKNNINNVKNRLGYIKYLRECYSYAKKKFSWIFDDKTYSKYVVK